MTNDKAYLGTAAAADGKAPDLNYSVSFNFSDVTETLGRTIVLYECPYVDGAFSDDTGEAPDRISFTAKFRGADYDKHIEFANVLKTYKKLWWLSHPSYPSPIYGRVEKATITHNESRTACSVAIDFVETMDREPHQRKPAINAARSTNATARTIISTSAADMENIITRLLNTIGNIGQTIANWLALLEDRVSALEGLAAAISAPANSIVAGVKFANSLIGRMSAAIMSVVEAYIAAGEALASLPELVVSTVRAIEDAIDSIVQGLSLPADMIDQFKASSTAAYAAIAGVYFARRLQADNDARSTQQSYEAIDSWTASGDYIPPRSFDTATSAPEYLSAIDLGKVIYAQADMIQQATVLARATSTDDTICRLLAQQQRTISDFVHNMILQTGSIIEVDLGNEGMPLFILLQRYGLSYKAADRVHVLNPQITNPIFYTGKVKIYEN